MNVLILTLAVDLSAIEVREHIFMTLQGKPERNLDHRTR